MCTLTFVPNENGYLLGMNRDEKITRGHAIPPSLVESGSSQAVYPQDVEGGTWIGASSRGITFALLNWNDVRSFRKTRSRGSVIPSLIGSSSMRNAHATLEQLEFQGVLPFRLIGFFPAERHITEWRWNQDTLQHEGIPWYRRQWCSSGLSDEEATRRRGLAYVCAQQEADRDSVAWLRRLHAVHDAEERRLSICVHRADVQTLSYSEVICTTELLNCNYLAGSPCLAKEPMQSVSIVRR